MWLLFQMPRNGGHKYVIYFVKSNVFHSSKDVAYVITHEIFLLITVVYLLLNQWYKEVFLFLKFVFFFSLGLSPFNLLKHVLCLKIALLIGYA